MGSATPPPDEFYRELTTSETRETSFNTPDETLVGPLQPLPTCSSRLNRPLTSGMTQTLSPNVQMMSAGHEWKGGVHTHAYRWPPASYLSHLRKLIRRELYDDCLIFLRHIVNHTPNPCLAALSKYVVLNFYRDKFNLNHIIDEDDAFWLMHCEAASAEGDPSATLILAKLKIDSILHELTNSPKMTPVAGRCRFANHPVVKSVNSELAFVQTHGNPHEREISGYLLDSLTLRDSISPKRALDTDPPYCPHPPPPANTNSSHG